MDYEVSPVLTHEDTLKYLGFSVSAANMRLEQRGPCVPLPLSPQFCDVEMTSRDPLGEVERPVGLGRGLGLARKPKSWCSHCILTALTAYV